jgi:DNA-directed RNA polymerase specialized sigma24 family protein
MTTRSGPGERQGDPSLSAAMSERRQLINLAHRLVGSLADAEDVVRDTYSRWYGLTAQQQSPSNPRRLVDEGASRLCLDLLSQSGVKPFVDGIGLVVERVIVAAGL